MDNLKNFDVNKIFYSAEPLDYKKDLMKIKKEKLIEIFIDDMKDLRKRRDKWAKDISWANGEIDKIKNFYEDQIDKLRIKLEAIEETVESATRCYLTHKQKEGIFILFKDLIYHAKQLVAKIDDLPF